MNKKMKLVEISGVSSEDGKFLRYNCEANGVFVGRIEYLEELGRYDKHHYRVQMLKSLRKHGFHDYYPGGEADSLIEARRLMTEKLPEWFEKHKEKKAELPPLLFSGDNEFYPTPEKLAGQLLSGVDLSKVDTVLEPSAGSGNLLDALERMKEGYLSQRFSYRYSIDKKLDVDCIEQDLNLQALLRGKGQKVVHDDFLTFQTRKKYDLILMNPPFSNGDEHLLHALELCRNGGQIACILNAETIRNPFTNRRKVLIRELRKYNASIRYVKDAFSHAEREARGDVALINVQIPESFNNDQLFEKLEQSWTAPDVSSEEKQELASSDYVERLITEFNMACDAGIELMKLYNSFVPTLKKSLREYEHQLISLKVAGDDYGECGSEAVKQFIKKTRLRYWKMFMDQPELRKKMTSKMQTKYDGMVQDMGDYDFTWYNINQILMSITEELHQGVEAAILSCFEKLSAEHSYHKDVENGNVHYFNGWKSNSAYKVNMKCIIPAWGMFAIDWSKGRDKLANNIEARSCFSLLHDLEMALNYLDKGETDPVDMSSVLEIAEKSGRTREIPLKYFTVTFYKKGTCHIKFKDQKIVDRLNIFVGKQKAWLPPTYGKVHYKDMDAESQRVVDEFQGKEKYEEIMQIPDDYLIEIQDSPLMLGA